MALRERGEQELFRVPPVSVPSERRICRSLDHRQVGGGPPDIMVARVGAVSRRARTQVACPLHPYGTFVIWHTKGVGMSRSAVHGAAKSVGEGVWVGWTGVAYRWDGGGPRRDDERCFINPSSRGARTDVISTTTALEQQERHPGHLPVRPGILVSGVTCRWSG